MQEARDWYLDYTPSSFATTQFETNWKLLQSKKVQELNQEIGKLRDQLAARKKAKSADSSTSANSATPDLKHGKGRSIERQRGSQTRSGVTVLEVILFSDPTRRHYISIPWRTTTLWNIRSLPVSWLENPSTNNWPRT